LGGVGFARDHSHREHRGHGVGAQDLRDFGWGSLLTMGVGELKIGVEAGLFGRG